LISSLSLSSASLDLIWGLRNQRLNSYRCSKNATSE
jgi:hypothetical protein